MLSLKYFRCQPVAKIGKSYSTLGTRLQVLIPIKARSHQTICKVRRFQFIPVRHFFKRKTTEGVSFKPAHLEDKVSERFKLIFYNNAMNYYVYGIRLVYFGSIAIGAFIFKYLLKRCETEFAPQQVKATVGNYKVEDPLYFCLLGIPLIVFWTIGCARISRNVPLRIYCDQSRQEYAGRFLRYGLYRHTEFFTQADIQPLSTGSMWTGNMTVKGRKVLILEQNFQTVSDYNRFMGYDYERASDLQRSQQEEDMVEMLSKGLRQHQNQRYRSFEQKYHEKRRLRNMQ